MNIRRPLFWNHGDLKSLNTTSAAVPGEIDLVARDGEYLVFVEVKYRQNKTSGRAAAAVDRRKQHMISRTALLYLMCRGYSECTDCRFDVVAFDGEKIQWIRNAFDFI